MFSKLIKSPIPEFYQSLLIYYCYVDAMVRETSTLKCYIFVVTAMLSSGRFAEHNSNNSTWIVMVVTQQNQTSDGQML